MPQERAVGMTLGSNDDVNARLLFVGDLFLGGEFLKALPTLPDGFLTPFKALKPIFSQADLRFGNFESPLDGRGPMREGKGSILSAPSDALAALTFLEFDVLSLGNNHIMDFGAESLIATKELFAAEGIATVGAGRSLTEARAHRTLSRDGLRIAYLAYTTAEAHVNAVLATDASAGCVPYRWELLKADLDRAAKASDLVCVSLHWGYEYSRYPSPDQIALAHRIIDHGAAIVVGHHPHLVQGYERYRQGVIFYSLGNFFFPDYRYKHGLLHRWPEMSRTSLIACCDVGSAGDLAHVELFPCLQMPTHRLTLLDERERAGYLQRVEKWSQRIHSRDFDSFWVGYLQGIERYLESREAGKTLQAAGKRLRTGNLRSLLQGLSTRSFRTLARAILRVLRRKFSPRERKG
jgi:poly-gamma-glutamate synthesis protein (capsule biosynthesis protein)